MIGFQTPEGVKDELFKEYEEKQNLIKKIEKLFKSYAYREVATPTIEYYEMYSSIKSTVLKDEIFKLIDNTGEILALRPDATIPIARTVANNYKYNKGNYKLFYKTQVFRMDNERTREITQIGVEYFGNKNIEADAESIALAIKSLLMNDLDFKIEIGSVGYYKGLLEATKLLEAEKIKLKELIENKNFVEIKKFVGELEIEDMLKKILIDMPNLYGNMDEIIEKASSYCLNDKMRKSLDELIEINKILKDYDYEEYISVDLGLINNLDYYTGVIYKGYLKGYGEKIISGGRYDNLTKIYGETIPATGFGIFIDDLIKGIEIQDKLDIIKEEVLVDYKINYEKEVRKKAIQLANKLREKEFTVELNRVNKLVNKKIEVGIRNIINIDKNEKLEMVNEDGSKKIKEIDLLI